MDEGYKSFREALKSMFDKYFANQSLLVTIHHAIWPITPDILQQIFSPYGSVKTIIPFQKMNAVQFLVQFQGYGAIAARNSLQGRNIYDGCCQLDIQICNNTMVTDVAKMNQDCSVEATKSEEPSVNTNVVESKQESTLGIINDIKVFDDLSVSTDEDAYVAIFTDSTVHFQDSGVITDSDDQTQYLFEISQPKTLISEGGGTLTKGSLEPNAKSFPTKTTMMFEQRYEESDVVVCDTEIMKIESLLADEKLTALQEEVSLLWDVSRKNNFELHVLESKAQDAKDRLEAVTSKVEKTADVVTEQWIQNQHLEQALQIAQMRAVQYQRQRYMRCTFLKFIIDLSEIHLPKMFKALEHYSFGLGSTVNYYMSQALLQLRRLYSAIKKYHHELQGFIKLEMQRNEFTAAFVNDEMVFFLASALITFPVLSAWMVLSSQFG